jgi:copper/silver efflux system protein
VEVNRPEAAKYGLTIADVQAAVSSGIGGTNIAENVEGRERYPINVRYQRDFRDNLDELRRVLIATPSGAQIPIDQLASISFARGPAMIRDEDGQLTATSTLTSTQTTTAGSSSKPQAGFSKTSACPPVTPTSGPANTSLNCVPGSV